MISLLVFLCVVFSPSILVWQECGLANASENKAERMQKHPNDTLVGQNNTPDNNSSIPAATKIMSVGKSGLPLPRFASLQANEVNMRQGPGKEYKILWKYKRKYLPVEIDAEFGPWRRVQDFENINGWIHKVLLSSKKTVIVISESATIYSHPSTSSNLIAEAEKGVVAIVLRCKKSWCRIKNGATSGWIDINTLWGATD
jgi:SH3-like domain-containing protein